MTGTVETTYREALRAALREALARDEQPRKCRFHVRGLRKQGAGYRTPRAHGRTLCAVSRSCSGAGTCRYGTGSGSASAP